MFLKRFFALMTLVFSSIILAFNPTPEQIAQFKKLPEEQQQALAKQYGVDISTLGSATTSGAVNPQTKKENINSILPRDIEREEEEVVEDPLKPKVEELEPFGYDLFSGEPTTFAPTEAVSAPQGYIIGVGDVISVNLYGKESHSHRVIVDGEGMLSIPDYSPVSVAGLTYSELKKLLQEKIKREAIGLNAYVSLAELRSIRVMVVGEAYKPGSYVLSPLSTVTHALFASGGLSDIASLRSVQVKRDGNVAAELDLYDLLLRGDSAGDITLRDGDVVFVPSVGPQVKVEGMVRRAAIFELKNGESAQELKQMFGGFKAEAYLKKVQVNRVVDNAVSSALSVDYRNASETTYVPQGGDHIKVMPVGETIVDSITLIGAVTRPGHYQWKDGISVDQILTNLKTDLLPQADLEYAIIVRERDQLSNIEVLQFSINDVLTGKKVMLQKNDKLFIFSRFSSALEEEEVLVNLALTAEQKSLQEKVKLWHLYEHSQFEQKVLFGLSLDEKSVGIKERYLEKKAAGLAPFSREQLLAPINLKLQQQASVGSQVATFEVLGKVKFPGIYPLAENATIEDAIDAAGGLLESAYAEYFELTRYAETGEISNLRLDWNAETAEERLQSRDTVNILTKPNWQESYRVSLQGEVNFPGTYSVKRGDTLHSLIQRAGGLTGFAEPKAAILTRESLKEQEEKQIETLSENLRKDLAARSMQKSVSSASLSYSDMNKIMADLSKVEAVGRLVIDLPRILSKMEDVVLQDGDTLYVPVLQDSISIIGEVNYPSAHLFRKGISLDEYIDLSGGMKDRAEEDQIYIIKANGSVVLPRKSSWFAVEDHQGGLEAGDTIVVPMDSSHMDNFTLWSTATQIAYQLGIALAAITSL
ncbi:polysaccharide biosynthesis protein [Pseudoalteromonas rubra]|uniref:Polysaccharide biosynthesis protein n=1 Tax=Pseudoalteromonas rubra TaxID=43658 RepID=A0A5S3V236_9GAMM|nr:SLBB domain-containing protein [Pseudoalteromonas rubra]QPB84657.1 polysaccharide biosynthesis protein [Pseudoalteromonas rubra]